MTPAAHWLSRSTRWPPPPPCVGGASGSSCTTCPPARCTRLSTRRSRCGASWAEPSRSPTRRCEPRSQLRRPARTLARRPAPRVRPIPMLSYSRRDRARSAAGATFGRTALRVWRRPQRRCRGRRSATSSPPEPASVSGCAIATAIWGSVVRQNRRCRHGRYLLSRRRRPGRRGVSRSLMDEFDEIVREFLLESYENLDQLDRDLVALEQEPDAHPLLQSIFRTIHTIKGTSGFLAFAKLEVLTHAGEGLLARLRDGGLRLTQARTTALLELMDAVRGILASIESTGAEDDRDYSDLVGVLKALQEPTSDVDDTVVRAADGMARARAGAASAPAESLAPSESPAPVEVAAMVEVTNAQTPAKRAGAAKPKSPTRAPRPSRAAGSARKPARKAVSTPASTAASTPQAAPASPIRSTRSAARPTVSNADRSEAAFDAADRPELNLHEIPLLGELLQAHSDIDAQDVAVAMLEQQLGDARPLGEILVHHGQATPDQVREALDAQAEAKAGGSVADSSLRVDVTLLDTLMRLVGEL